LRTGRAGAPENEIEATPAMISAGVKVISQHFDQVPDWLKAERRENLSGDDLRMRTWSARIGLAARRRDDLLAHCFLWRLRNRMIGFRRRDQPTLSRPASR
jgi:hypothetical protein